MVTIRQKTLAAMHLEGACRSHARTDVRVRDLELVIDEPTERGGTNQGAAPTEVMVASLIGCTNVITQRIAEGKGVHIRDMSVEADVSFDRRGVTLAEEVDVPFPSITLKIALTTDASEAEVDAVRTDLGKYCPIAKVLRQAGTVIDEEWTVSRP